MVCFIYEKQSKKSRRIQNINFFSPNVYWMPNPYLFESHATLSIENGTNWTIPNGLSNVSPFDQNLSMIWLAFRTPNFLFDQNLFRIWLVFRTPEFPVRPKSLYDLIQIILRTAFCWLIAVRPNFTKPFNIVSNEGFPNGVLSCYASNKLFKTLISIVAWCNKLI
jgi:hypothetical protein